MNQITTDLRDALRARGTDWIDSVRIEYDYNDLRCSCIIIDARNDDHFSVYVKDLSTMTVEVAHEARLVPFLNWKFMGATTVRRATTAPTAEALADLIVATIERVMSKTAPVVYDNEAVRRMFREGYYLPSEPSSPRKI